MTDAREEQLPVADRNDLHLVGIGASAGGLEAIEIFFRNIPAKTGAAFFVVQHLSPDFESLMDQLLARHTPLPIQIAEEGLVAEADRIYLIPPRTYMRIRDGQLRLSRQEKDRTVPLPIDIFFRSLAEDAGERTVGVILSGTGSDGTRGVQEIKAAGGVVMVQDIATAKFDGMPIAAIATGVADVVASPNKMGETLVAYLKSPATSYIDGSSSVSLEPLREIVEIIRAETGIDFSHYKAGTLQRRLNRRLGIVQIEDVAGYRHLIRESSEERNRLVQDLLIGVTEFFRDPFAFARLEEEIPHLVQLAGDDPLRVWVAGCSTGEEAYSIAMQLEEYRRRVDSQFEYKIFATDVNQVAIARASEGNFSAGIAETMSNQRLEDFFDATTGGYRIRRAIRDRVVFAQHNLIKDPPFTRIHLISCRNMLIYIQPEGQSRVLHNFHFALVPKGVLFLGPSEGPMDLKEEFLELDSKHKILKKRRDVRLSAGGEGGPNPSSINLRLRNAIAPVRTYLDFDRIAGSFLSEFVPTCLVLEEDGTIVHTFGDARHLLTLPVGRATLNAIDMMSQEARTCVTTSMSKSRTSGGEAVRYENVCIRQDDLQTRADLTVKYLAPSRDGDPALFLLMVGDPVKVPAPATLQLNSDAESASRLDLMDQELQHTRDNLQSAIEELQTTNEELQSTNEELLASNEELQSTNEELHSVNEELYTVNTEHQKKIEELTEMTSDMENLLRSIEIATVFLDRGLRIRKFTAKAGEVVRLRDSDIGRPIGHLACTLKDVDLDEIANTVVKSAEPIEVTAKDGEGLPHLVRVLPYIQDGLTQGAVITIIDLRAAIEAAPASIEAQRALQKLIEHLNEACWITSPDGVEIDYISPQLEKLWGIPMEDLYKDGLSWVDVVHPEDREQVVDGIQSTLPAGEYDLEYRIVTPASGERRIHAKGFPVHDKLGQVVRIAGFFKELPTA